MADKTYKEIDISSLDSELAAGMLMFIPGTVTDLAGLAAAALLLLINIKKWRRRPEGLRQTP